MFPNVSTDEAKLLRLAGELAQREGLEVVVHEYRDGSGLRISFQSKDDFASVIEVLHFRRRHTCAHTFKQIQEALGARV